MVLIFIILIFLTGCWSDYRHTEEYRRPDNHVTQIKTPEGFTYSTFCFRGKLYLERYYATTYTGEPCND